MTDQLTGQILAKKYRIDSLLREDDLGTVYRGTHVSMDKSVTIKILASALAVDENIVRQFSAEAKTASRISHPNILNVTDFGVDAENRVYIVFEGPDGENLQETIREEGRFAPDRAVNLTRQIASALSAANAVNIIHANLSSRNILLARAPNNAEMAKVTSFGAVRLSDRETVAQEASGRDVAYFSPEQCTDENAADARSNVYNLGVILYEMLAGEVPFAGATQTDVMLKHSQEPPPPLSAFRHDLPAGLEGVMLKALAKNPEMRYQTADEFSDDLSRISGNYHPSVLPLIPAKTATETSNNLWKTAFIVLAGISLLAVTLIYATSIKQTNPATILQTDGNGQPVQPINPATGADEQNLDNMSSYPTEMMSNTNLPPMGIPPGTSPSSDGINPWAGGGYPPRGAPPQYVQPGGATGPTVMIDPNTGSPFMPNESGVVLVPVPINANTSTNTKPSPTPKGTKTSVPANAAPSPAPTETPKTTAQPTPDAKVTPTPKTEKTPAKPAAAPATPKPNAPAATEKRSQSGKPQDS